MKVFFSDYFKVSAKDVESYGAFNISLLNDLPLFIDPFLLFNSSKQEYQYLHNDIIAYVDFLRGKSLQSGISAGLLKAWYLFPEVKQTWLGYSKKGNRGSGLGNGFASALNRNLNSIFTNFGSETITKGSHLEKLCLVRDGVGKDNISDFVTNLIKSYLLKYTQDFAQKYISPQLRQDFNVSKVNFNYSTESWESACFDLPCHNGDYVILCPRDILTKDEPWINKNDLLGNFKRIVNSISNEALRAQINNYFFKILPPVDPTKKEVREAKAEVVSKFPQIIDYFIKDKEDNGDKAIQLSEMKVSLTEKLYIDRTERLIKIIAETSKFYEIVGSSDLDTINKVRCLKEVLETEEAGIMLSENGRHITNEDELGLLMSLVWRAEIMTDKKMSDKKTFRRAETKVHFKLGSNHSLKRFLEKKFVTKSGVSANEIVMVFCSSDEENERYSKIIKELALDAEKNLIPIHLDYGSNSDAMLDGVLDLDVQDLPEMKIDLTDFDIDLSDLKNGLN